MENKTPVLLTNHPLFDAPLLEISLISSATTAPNHTGHEEHKDSKIIVEIFFVPIACPVGSVRDHTGVNFVVKECLFKDKPGKDNNLSRLLLGEFFPQSSLVKIAF